MSNLHFMKFIRQRGRYCKKTWWSVLHASAKSFSKQCKLSEHASVSSSAAQPEPCNIICLPARPNPNLYSFFLFPTMAPGFLSFSFSALFKPGHFKVSWFLADQSCMKDVLQQSLILPNVNYTWHLPVTFIFKSRWMSGLLWQTTQAPIFNIFIV